MGVRRNIHYQDSCIYCGQCVNYCTTREGIKHTQQYELSSLTQDGYANEIQGELVFCEICGEVVAPKKQLLWIAHKVGALVSANPNLYLTLYRELGLTEATAQEGDRAVPLRIPCACSVRPAVGKPTSKKPGVSRPGPGLNTKAQREG